jgi:uncharacterized protein YuzE
VNHPPPVLFLATLGLVLPKDYNGPANMPICVVKNATPGSGRMNSGSLHFTHDSRADAAYVYLRYPVERGDTVRTELVEIECPERASLVFSFDEYDRLLGIEVLGASRVLPPELLAS